MEAEQGMARIESIGWWLAHLVVAAALLWIAFVNGAPLVFPDTGTYLLVGKTLFYPIDRPLTYGLLIAPLHHLAGLWPVVIGQAAFTAWVVGLTLSAVMRRRSPLALLFVGLALAGLTSLPWFAGQIMPDFMTGLLALVIYLLLFELARSPAPRWLLSLLVIALVMSHLSHIPLALGLVAVGTLVAALTGDRRPAINNGLAGMAAILVAVLGLSAMNYAAKHQFKPSLFTDTFILARLFDGHLAQPALANSCAEAPLRLCAARPLVDDPASPKPGQDFLWQKQSPLWPLARRDPARLGAEEALLIRRTMAAQPGAVIKLAMTGWGRQLVTTRAGSELSAEEPDSWVFQVIRRYFPGDFRAWSRSLQQQGRVRKVHGFPDRKLAILVVLLCPWIIWRAIRQRRRPLIGLATITLATIILNAAICGALSGPADRYQSRVLWLLPLLGAIALIDLMEATRNRRTPSTTSPTPALP